RTPAPLDMLASPYQIGVAKKRAVAYLETFRGCPFSCSFCEWGATGDSKAVFSTDYITRELESYSRFDVSAVFSVDAGLNLNHQAFRNLREAEKRVGILRKATFWSEIYPSLIKDEHLEFLSTVHATYLGIGLQSTDPAVLKDLQRPFDQRRLETIVGQVADVAEAELQVIFGLPGDSPAGFRRTLEFARTMPAGVRAYGCLVLPDALMTRGKPEWNIVFDPITLRMKSCAGWSEDELQSTRAWVTEEVRKAGGRYGDYWWYFPRKR
ncbi:MAG TPA: radical SAM protein, partial [Burkholderiales bacterium]|nr:radical SAM protein [Burkholderiales bacterium]